MKIYFALLALLTSSTGFASEVHLLCHWRGNSVITGSREISLRSEEPHHEALILRNTIKQVSGEEYSIEYRVSVRPETGMRINARHGWAGSWGTESENPTHDPDTVEFKETLHFDVRADVHNENLENPSIAINCIRVN